MHIHTSYELYLYAQDKMAAYEKEAEWNRLLAEARAPRGLRRSLALLLYRLAAKLAPEVRSEPQWQGSQRRAASS